MDKSEGVDFIYKVADTNSESNYVTKSSLKIRSGLGVHKVDASRNIQLISVKMLKSVHLEEMWSINASFIFGMLEESQ